MRPPSVGQHGLIEMEEGSEDGLALANDSLPQDCNIHQDLKGKLQKELRSLVEEFSDVFCDISGKTETVEQEIIFTSIISVHK